jgi:glycosyltransferase involved in cell wall biosynthesis
MRSSAANTNYEPPTASASQPLVSVVTPVHNTADHLADCIRSVLVQSYPAWEYVIVDNACTDGSREIAESFAAKEPRIRIVQTQGLLPQVQNYNFALRQISPHARYCKMVQADDWIYPTCLQEMVALAETDSEIAIVNAYRIGSDFVYDHGLVCLGPDHRTTVSAGRDACRRFLLDRRYIFGSPTSVFYRADLVRSRAQFFREVDSGYFEDAELCFDVLENAKFGFIHQILSCGRWGNASVTSCVRDFDPSHRLMSYVVTKRYGPRYLSDSEFRACKAKTERAYYELLARQVPFGRKSGFWRWHARGLEQSGEQIDWSRIALLQFPRLLNVLGNPKAALGALSRGLLSFARRPSGLNMGPTYY